MMDEKDREIQELKRDIAKLRGWVVEAVAKACFNCEEYREHADGRCEKCSLQRMKDNP